MKQSSELKSWQVMFMACCTGLIVSNIYYCQPLVVLVAPEFHVAESKAAAITFYTQLGYALGLLFLVPLGDMLEKRKQIVLTTGFAVLFLIAAALSPSLPVLCAASLLIGATSIVPQLILPLAAHLAPAEWRGKIIGTVMSGLLIGILLSRTLSGLVGAWLGWRSMFWIAAGISAGLLVAMQLIFPRVYSEYGGSYRNLMRSLITLTKEQPVLREAAAINGLTFASFGIFWTTMVLHLSDAPFHFNSGQIGLFGLAAVAGALVAPLIGGAADKRNPRIAIGYGLLIVGISYFIFYGMGNGVTGMIIGIVLLDLGQQSVHVSNQTRVYALLPSARNRLNTVYMTVSFIGTSLGSILGLWVWDRAGWTGVCFTGVPLIAAALTIYAVTYKRPVKSPELRDIASAHE